MRHAHLPSISFLCGLALWLAGPVAWAGSDCASLSGCPYQAGQGLPGANTASPQSPAPEVRPPVSTNSCDAGGCLDPNGTRYNGRTAEPQADIYLDAQGRRCIRNGVHLQCG